MFLNAANVLSRAIFFTDGEEEEEDAAAEMAPTKPVGRENGEPRYEDQVDKEDRS